MVGFTVKSSLHGRQGNAPGTARTLALAEQRLIEAAAELARRGAALQQMEHGRDSANAQVQSSVISPSTAQGMGYTGSYHCR